MSMKAYFLMNAEYNRWVNVRILNDCATLTEHEYHRDMGAVFSSVHDSLNHLFSADTIWLHRFTGEGEGLETYEDILFDDLEDLRAARTILDERIISFFQQLDEADIDRELLFRTARRPSLTSRPFPLAVAHFFAHQVHHRAQIHVFIRQFGKSPRPIDIIHFREETSAEAES